MKNFIIITGDLATGKTTLGNNLSKYFGYPFIYKDRIKELISDNVGFQDREENKKISFATFDVMLFIVEQIFEISGSVILESNLRQNELDLLYKKANEFQYNVITLVLKGSIDILHNRYMSRIFHENRHPAHYVFSVREEFESYVIKSRDRNYKGDTIRINADHFNYMNETFYNTIYNKLSKNKRKFKAHMIGGSVSGLKIHDNCIIKYCNIHHEGVENGYTKLKNEVDHIREVNKVTSNLYPEICFERYIGDVYEVGYRFMYGGFTFADLLRNEDISDEYIDKSIEKIIYGLYDKLYSKKQKFVPDKDYLKKFYFDRMKRRLKTTIKLSSDESFCSELESIIDKGIKVNNIFYPSIYKYIEFIENNTKILEKLEIKFSTDSHHDLIPGNILVELGSESIKDFRLIDPRGQKDTGMNNRNSMYDFGKLLFGITSYDIFRLYNGKQKEKAYHIKYIGSHQGIREYNYSFDHNCSIVKRSGIARKNLLEKLNETSYQQKIGEKDLLCKILFSESTMLISDIPCRIVDEKNEEMCLVFLIEGILTMSRFLEFELGIDPLKDNYEVL